MDFHVSDSSVWVNLSPTLIHSSSPFATVSVSPTIAPSAPELPLATIPFLSPSQRLSRLPHFASAALLFRPFAEPLAFVAARLRGLIGLPVLMLPTTLLHLLVLNGLGGADPFAVLPRPAALISSSVLEGPTQMVSPGLDVELSPSALATVPSFALLALFRPARTPSSHNSRLRSSVRSRVTSSLYPMRKRRDAADS